MNTKNYTDIPGFEHIYLEESYLLDVFEGQSNVILKIDAVLTEEHPLYQPPNDDSYYCYRLAEIEFPHTKKVTWLTKSMHPYKDANGEIDYGNIDIFTWTDDHIFHLQGDWGSMDIESDMPAIQFL